jgi:hypothetical protein
MPAIPLPVMMKGQVEVASIRGMADRAGLRAGFTSC